jgi:uncharacterized membrane protein YeaQ/YmgE (transglycosylase-associated protein family)
MKRSVILTIASLLSILLLLFHLTDDLVRGISRVGPLNLVIVPVVAGWLYGTMVLAERRSGYIINLLGGIIALAMPVVHLRSAGPYNFLKTSGSFFFLWTLLTLGVTGLFSIILSVRGLWNPQWGQSR